MTSTGRKRIWREQNPERRREAERVRAQARRDGYWNLHEWYVAVQAWSDAGRVGDAPSKPRPCASTESNRKYEFSMKRFRQRLRYAFSDVPEILATIAQIPDVVGDDLTALNELIRKMTDEMGLTEIFEEHLGPLINPTA
jgi:hypothetical protein